jgi:hypothetical protein
MPSHHGVGLNEHERRAPVSPCLAQHDPKQPIAHPEPKLCGGHAQHPAFLVLGATGADPQPHPVPPVDFTSASRAQQASAPIGAGPPQHVLGVPVAWVVDELR